MKKFICIVLSVIIVFALASCDSQNNSPQNTSSINNKPKEIQLTTSNINEYLSIEGSYGKITRETKLGISFGYSDFTISIYPSVPGYFSNVEIELEINLTYGWDVSSSDPAFSDNDGYLRTTIKLPANGTKEEVHDLIASMSYGNHSNSPYVKIVSVTGTFQPLN